MGHQGVVAPQVEALFIQGIGGVLHPEIPVGLADKDRHTVQMSGLLDHIGQVPQNLADAELVVDVLGKPVDFLLLLPLIPHKDEVQHQGNDAVDHQHQNHQNGRHGHHRCGVVQPHLAGKEGLQRVGNAVGRNTAQSHGDHHIVHPGQQQGHPEQLLLVQGIEHEEHIAHTGKDIQGQTLENGQGGRHMAQQQDTDAVDDGLELLEGDAVALAVPAHHVGDVHHAGHHADHQEIDVPVIVVNKLGRAAPFHHQRLRDEPAGQAVHHKQQQVEPRPEPAPPAVPLLQEVQGEVIVARGQHHHAQHRHMVPQVHRRPQLHTHGKGAAHPEDHDEHQHHKGPDDPLLPGGCQEGQQQEEITEKGCNGDPTISSHPFHLFSPGSQTGDMPANR